MPYDLQWRLIDNAPKDVTVLIYVPDDDDGEIYKVAKLSNLAAQPGWFYRGGWLAKDEPTHWRPLLPPKSVA